MSPLQLSLQKHRFRLKKVHSTRSRIFYLNGPNITFFLILNLLFFPTVLSGFKFHSAVSTSSNNQNSTPDAPLSFAPSFESPSSFTLDESRFMFPGFTENRGQIDDSDLCYYFMQETYIIGFYEAQIQVFSRLNGLSSWEDLTITFPGASACIPQGITRLMTTTNYFIHSPAIVAVPQWAEIRYTSLYPGITLRFYADAQALKYEFIVASGVDPAVIQLDVGESTVIDMSLLSDHVRCTSHSIPNLVVWEDQSPIGIQMGNPAINIQFRSIELSNERYGFTIGEYDHTKELVIDPITFLWSSYLGGSDLDQGIGIAVDFEGCIYITGSTTSTNYPTVNAYDTTFNGGGDSGDVFVTKLAADGQSVIYSTYLGGSNIEEVHDIAVDTEGCAYITGFTTSSDFPMVNAYDATMGWLNAFVTKFAADGQSLLYSTYLGGSMDDRGYGIAVDSEGCAYITGQTESDDFPTVNAYDTTINLSLWGSDAFVTKFAADGQSLIYSTYLGGSYSDSDAGNGIAVDIDGCAYIVGYTSSSDFPIVNAYDATLNNSDIFVTKFAADGQSLIYSTYLGGSDYDGGNEIAVDTDGCVFIAGDTCSFDFPTVNAYDASYNGDKDVSITKLASDGQSLIFSTYLGGSDYEMARGITVDTLGCVYVTGDGYSQDFPIVNASTAILGGEAFATKLTADGQSLAYSISFGGSNWDYGDDIAVDNSGNAYITGYTNSPDFPCINAYDTTFNGAPSDCFVVRLAVDNDNDEIPDLWEFQMGLNASDPTDATLDKDDDGMPNLWEFQMGLNATDPSDVALDKDEDGMPNLWEYQMHFDANDPSDASHDKDKDFMPNLWEYRMGLNATDPSDAALDKDDDGMPNLWEFWMGLNATNPGDAELDKDGDGMPNLWEYQMGLNAKNPSDAALDKDGDGMPNLWEYQMGLNATDPTDATLDKDADGMPNLWEFQMGLNATDPIDVTLDKDDDGMLNFWEFQMGLNATNPGDAELDKDSDGMPNLWEYQMGLDATNSGDAELDKDNDDISNLLEYQIGSNANNPDSDGDLMPDGWEYQMGLNASDPSDAALDNDEDGLSNYEEFIKGTSPNDPDTDLDGWGDKEDPLPLIRIPQGLFYGSGSIIALGVLALAGFLVYRYVKLRK